MVNHFGAYISVFPQLQHCSQVDVTAPRQCRGCTSAFDISYVQIQIYTYSESLYHYSNKMEDVLVMMYYIAVLCKLSCQTDNFYLIWSSDFSILIYSCDVSLTQF